MESTLLASLVVWVSIVWLACILVWFSVVVVIAIINDVLRSVSRSLIKHRLVIEFDMIYEIPGFLIIAGILSIIPGIFVMVFSKG